MLTVLRRVEFIPHDGDYCLLDFGPPGRWDDSHRNAYQWTGSYYYFMSECLQGVPDPTNLTPPP